MACGTHGGLDRCESFGPEEAQMKRISEAPRTHKDVTPVMGREAFDDGLVVFLEVGPDGSPKPGWVGLRKMVEKHGSFFSGSSCDFTRRWYPLVRLAGHARCYRTVPIRPGQAVPIALALYPNGNMQ